MDNESKYKKLAVTNDNYPTWTCSPCALENGGYWPDGHIGCWHEAKCQVCGDLAAVTQPRDFRWPKFKTRIEE